MEDHEVQLQTKRIEAFRDLKAEAERLNGALAVLDTPFGVHKQSAFTGNTRESRQIVEMTLRFSQTRGGEKPEELTICPLGVPAGRVGDVLRDLLSERLRAVRAEMAKL